jgi:hypothetical protein
VLPVTPAPKFTTTADARAFFSAAQNLAVSVNGATVSRPELGLPAARLKVDQGGTVKIVAALSDETKMPIGVNYELLNGPTLLANFLKIEADFLDVDDGRVLLSRAAVVELAKEISGPLEKPSGIKHRR